MANRSKRKKLARRLFLVFVFLVFIFLISKRIPIKEKIFQLKKLINNRKKKICIILLKKYILIINSKYRKSKFIRKWVIIPGLKILISRLKKRFIDLGVKNKK